MLAEDELNPSLVRWLMLPEVPEPLALEQLIRRPPWMAEAACRSEPRETFFPGRGGSTMRAKRMCAGCPVQTPCAAYAMEDPDIDGIWAGTSLRERDRLRQKAAGAVLCSICAERPVVENHRCARCARYRTRTGWDRPLALDDPA